MAASGSFAGEVRVRLALDTNDLRTQIDTAEQKIGGGKGIELPVSFKKGAGKDLNSGLHGKNGLEGELEPIMLTAGIDKSSSVTLINKQIREMEGIKGVKIPVKLDMSNEDRKILSTAPDARGKAIRQAIGRDKAAATTAAKKREARQFGGPVNANEEYLVGENGPEVVQFSRPGRVLHAGRSRPNPPRAAMGKRRIGPSERRYGVPMRLNTYDKPFDEENTGPYLNYGGGGSLDETWPADFRGQMSNVPVIIPRRGHPSRNAMGGRIRGLHEGGPLIAGHVHNLPEELAIGRYKARNRGEAAPMQMHPASMYWAAQGKATALDPPKPYTGSHYRDPKTGRWERTVVRSQEEVENWSNLRLERAVQEDAPRDVREALRQLPGADQKEWRQSGPLKRGLLAKADPRFESLRPTPLDIRVASFDEVPRSSRIDKPEDENARFRRDPLAAVERIETTNLAVRDPGPWGGAFRYSDWQRAQSRRYRTRTSKSDPSRMAFESPVGAVDVGRGARVPGTKRFGRRIVLSPGVGLDFDDTKAEDIELGGYMRRYGPEAAVAATMGSAEWAAMRAAEDARTARRIASGHYRGPATVRVAPESPPLSYLPYEPAFRGNRPIAGPSAIPGAALAAEEAAVRVGDRYLTGLRGFGDRYLTGFGTERGRVHGPTRARMTRTPSGLYIPTGDYDGPFEWGSLRLPAGSPQGMLSAAHAAHELGMFPTDVLMPSGVAMVHDAGRAPMSDFATKLSEAYYGPRVVPKGYSYSKLSRAEQNRRKAAWKEQAYENRMGTDPRGFILPGFNINPQDIIDQGKESKSQQWVSGKLVKVDLGGGRTVERETPSLAMVGASQYRSAKAKEEFEKRRAFLADPKNQVLQRAFSSLRALEKVPTAGSALIDVDMFDSIVPDLGGIMQDMRLFEVELRDMDAATVLEQIAKNPKRKNKHVLPPSVYERAAGLKERLLALRPNWVQMFGSSTDRPDVWAEMDEQAQRFVEMAERTVGFESVDEGTIRLIKRTKPMRHKPRTKPTKAVKALKRRSWKKDPWESYQPFSQEEAEALDRGDPEYIQAIRTRGLLEGLGMAERDEQGHLVMRGGMDTGVQLLDVAQGEFLRRLDELPRQLTESALGGPDGALEAAKAALKEDPENPVKKTQVKYLRGQLKAAREGGMAMGGAIQGYAPGGTIAARALAPDQAAGRLPALAGMPGAVLVGEHGPEVIVPSGPGTVFPNHWDGDPDQIPQFHSGGGIAWHPHPHGVEGWGQSEVQTTMGLPETPPARRRGWLTAGQPGAGPPRPTTETLGASPNQLEMGEAAAAYRATDVPLALPEYSALAHQRLAAQGRRRMQGQHMAFSMQGPNGQQILGPVLQQAQQAGQQAAGQVAGAFVQGMAQRNAGQQQQAQQAGQQAGIQGPQPVAPAAARPNLVGLPPDQLRSPANVRRAAGRAGALATPGIYQGGTQFAGKTYEDAIAGIRSSTSEQLSLTPVRALSVSIGQIAQTALGGRAGIMARATQANAVAARAQRQAGFLERERETMEGALYEIRRLRTLGVRPAARGTALDQMTPEEQAYESVRNTYRDASTAVQRQEPIVSKLVGEAEAASKGVASRRQKLTSQTLGVGGIVTGTVLFSTAMQVAQAAIKKFSEAVGPAVDELTGFQKTMNRTTTELAKVARGGTGGTAEIAQQQARVGLSIETEALTRRARLLGGAQNLREVQSAVRANDAARNRDQLEGITGFRNGLFSGIPGLEALSFIGQDQGLDEVLKGTIGNRPGPVVQRDPLEQALTGQSGGTIVHDILAGFGRNNPWIEQGLTERATAQQEELDKFDMRLNDMFGQLNDDLDRIDPKMGDFVVNLGAGAEAVEATASALDEMGLGELAKTFREGQVAFRREDGGFATGQEELTRLLENTLLGQNMQDWGQMWTTMVPQLTAQIRGQQREAAYQQEVGIPAQFYRSTLSQPIMPANFGVAPSFGTSTFGGPLSATGISSKWIEQNQALVAQQEAAAAEGRQVMFDRIMRGRGFDEANSRVESGPLQLGSLDITTPFQEAAQYTQDWRDAAEDVNAQLDEIEAISKTIADLQVRDTDMQQALQQEQYNEQLRITKRSVGDALGMAGELSGTYRDIVRFTDQGEAVTEAAIVSATRYGKIQRAQMMDQRELSRIQLARSQRELNMQLALARLRSPGETAAERAVRRREAEAIASEQQKMLDINKRSTERGFVVQDIQLTRTAEDSLRRLGLMEGQRTLQIELQGSQANQKFMTRIRTELEKALDIEDSLGTQVDKAFMNAQTTIEGQTGEFRDTFVEETSQLMDIVLKQNQRVYTEFLDWMDRKNTEASGGGTSGHSGDQGGTYFPPSGGSGSGGSSDGDGDGSGLTYKQVLEYIQRFWARKEDPGWVKDQMQAYYDVNPDRTQRVAKKNGIWAGGGIFGVNQATSFIAGEAGSESVVVIRNPKLGMTSGGSMSPSGGGKSVTININASVRNDGDVDALVRKVVQEIHSQSEMVV